MMENSRIRAMGGGGAHPVETHTAIRRPPGLPLLLSSPSPEPNGLLQKNPHVETDYSTFCH
jgi:hypothetical protein